MRLVDRETGWVRFSSSHALMFSNSCNSSRPPLSFCHARTPDFPGCSGPGRRQPGRQAVTGRVVKVLPFLLDKQGRDSLSPSLFDRDAYQAHLRAHTNEVSAVRIDVLWKATKAPAGKIKIAVELRGVGTNNVPKLRTLEARVTPSRWNKWTEGDWTELPLAGEDYQSFGAVVAWRATLWNGDQKLGEQKSFLW